MLRYVIRRLLWGVVLVIAVIAITFVLFYLLPNVNPAQLRAGRNSSPKVIAEIAHALGTDKPVYTQFWHYIERLVLHFDLGFSFYSGADVKALILDRLPATISLAVGGVLIWLLAGIPVGIISAIKRRSAPGPHGDGHGARVRLGPRLLARAGGPVPVRLRHRSLSGVVPAWRRQLRRVDGQPLALVRIAADAVVRARRELRGHLRAAAARQPDRRDGRGLHPHRAGQGVCVSAAW